MTQDNQGDGESLAAQQVFGPQAAVYATSKVHIRDDSLESVERMVGAGGGSNRYRWMVDLGTGAGFTAFAVAMGAPFWFDLLNKVVNLRGGGGKPTRTPEAVPQNVAGPTPAGTPTA